MTNDELCAIRARIIEDITEGVSDLCQSTEVLAGFGKGSIRRICHGPLTSVMKDIQLYSENHSNTGETIIFVADFKPMYLAFEVHFEMQQGMHSLDIQYGLAFKHVCQRLLHELYEDRGSNFEARGGTLPGGRAYLV